MRCEGAGQRARRQGLDLYAERFRSEYDLDYDCYQEDFYDRVYDYQRVPSAMPAVPHGSSLPKRSRSSSSSTSLRRSRDRPSSKSSRPHSSSRAKLKMEELQTIKRELTLIKVQIDGLLDNLDRMDRQRQDHTGRAVSEAPPTTHLPAALRRLHRAPGLGAAVPGETALSWGRPAMTSPTRCIITAQTWKMKCEKAVTAPRRSWTSVM
ncbi:hypothetical protein AALO_G00187000 [Alosa alosa]|uniref:Uncharacterized protein n=1 Tax=Alosa alosa TaxID=278164 RepID=A0AAV6G4I0_9TELE|nr:hypothetical protein AALO_G00187000 [Alosa alosa]